MNKDKELYEKVELICNRINAYSEKSISVKNEVKTNAYMTKLMELYNKIENKSKNAVILPDAYFNESQLKTESDSIYDPYGNKFFYASKLEEVNGDIEKLIANLESEDQIGYRNAYIISEIKKFVDIKKFRDNMNNSKTENEEALSSIVQKTELSMQETKPMNFFEKLIKKIKIIFSLSAKKNKELVREIKYEFSKME